MAIAVNKDSVKFRFKDLGIVDNHTIFTVARRGLKVNVFYDFAAAIKMSEKNLASLINLSSRTISNYKLRKKPFEPSYSEHLLKLIALYEKGEDVFGNIDEFNYWLNKPYWNSKESPMDWLITPGGVDLVMEEIDQLQQGYPV